MEAIKNILNNLSERFPIVWDRYVDADNFYGIYGWIKRKDGQRDFILLQIWTEPEFIISFTTSSAKYSMAIGDYLYNGEVEHTDCKKVKDLLT